MFDSPVESGTETTPQQFLDKYILLHCAKLELSLIDVSSGQYHPENMAGMMKIFLRQNI